MSFQSMKKEDLLEVVDKVGGVDIAEDATKAEIITSLSEAGVTYGSYRKLYDPETEEEKAVAKAEWDAKKNILVKMDRKNPTFEYRGYKFTKQHPFEVLTEDDFDDLNDLYDGFRLATPREAKEYYS